MVVFGYSSFPSLFRLVWALGWVAVIFGAVFAYQCGDNPDFKK